MKVLIVSEPGIDGVFRQVDGLTRYLLAQNVEIALAYSDRRAGAALRALVADVEASGGRTLNLRVGNSPGPRDVAALGRLLMLAREFRPDVIHGHSSKAGALTRALWLLGIRAVYLYTPHAYFCMHGGGGAKSVIFRSVERLLAHIGQTVNLMGSEATYAAEEIGVPESHQVTIANGVDCERFCPATPEEKQRRRAELGIPDGALLLGSVGRSSTQKDPMTMYRALHLAREKLPNLHFLHLGQGELDPQINTFIEEKGIGSWIHRIPFSSTPAEIYQVFDCFILTSLYEGMSYAVLEALATDLPVVLTRAPGNLDFGIFGLSHLFWGESGDPASIAEAIVSWAKGGNEAPCNHRAIALEHLTEEECYRRVLDVYTDSDSDSETDQAPVPA